MNDIYDAAGFTININKFWDEYMHCEPGTRHTALCWLSVLPMQTRVGTNAEGRTLLHLAARAGDVWAFGMFCDLLAPALAARDTTGRTAFHYLFEVKTVPDDAVAQMFLRGPAMLLTEAGAGESWSQIAKLCMRPGLVAFMARLGCPFAITELIARSPALAASACVMISELLRMITDVNESGQLANCLRARGLFWAHGPRWSQVLALVEQSNPALIAAAVPEKKTPEEVVAWLCSALELEPV